MYQFCAPGSETPSIPLKYPERVKEGKREQEVKKNSQKHEAMVRVQGEKIQSEHKGDKRFEGECCISRRRLDGPDRAVENY